MKRKVTKTELIKELAKQQSINDQLITELTYLDDLVKKIGFEDGLKTLKKAAIDLLDGEEFQGPFEAM